MESWDDDNFEPTQAKIPPVPNTDNKWEGEDEDDDVKDNWEDEDEERERAEQQQLQQLEGEDGERQLAQQVPKRKPLAERIAEKERLKREEYERRMTKEKEDELSAEEQLRRQQESDLHLALETTFGMSDSGDFADGGGSGEEPESREQFQEYADSLLSRKLLPLCKKAEFPGFCEYFVRNLCATLTSQDIKKIKTTIDNLFLEKQKVEKGDKTKKNKGKGKAKLKLEGDNQYSAYVDDFTEYDDFM